MTPDVSGNVVFPDVSMGDGWQDPGISVQVPGYESAVQGGAETETLLLLGELQKQNDLLQSGFVCIFILLGLLVGVVWMKGFWRG